MSGSGSLKHGIKTKIISAKMSGGYAPSFALSTFQAVIGIGAGPPPIANGLEISLDEYFIFGDRIREIRWKMADSATGPSLYAFQAFETTISTLGLVSLGVSNTSNGTGNQQVLTISGLTTLVATDKFHTLSAFSQNGPPLGSGNVVFYPLEVDFDHP
jgi:hypothetical protein